MNDLFTSIPPSGSQCHTLLLALNRGERLTVADALSRYGCYALSQRMGELRRKYGWPVQSKMIEVNGKRVAEYWLELPQDTMSQYLLQGALGTATASVSPSIPLHP